MSKMKSSVAWFWEPQTRTQWKSNLLPSGVCAYNDTPEGVWLLCEPVSVEKVACSAFPVKRKYYKAY